MRSIVARVILDFGSKNQVVFEMPGLLESPSGVELEKKI